VITRYIIVASLAVIAVGSAGANEDKHIPASRCGAIWYGLNYDPPAPTSIDDVDPAARAKLKAYLAQRLGPDFAARLRFSGGQIVDRAKLKTMEPDSVHYKWRPPKYNLQFTVPVEGEADGFCASVHLDDDGTIMEPIGIPDLRRHPERGKIAPVAAAVEVARRQGVQLDKATRTIAYFPYTDTIEYEFTVVKHSDGLNTEYSTLHVVAHDTSRVHWTSSTAIR